MKKSFYLKLKFLKFWFFGIFFVLFICQTNLQSAEAISLENNQNGQVLEELRLKVPSKFKDVWLDAEKKIWDPWLSSKDGFLGRQIFWNEKNQEALILVKWENKKLWKDISIEEVNLIQEKFEKNVMSSLNLNQNPFKLIYEGELYRQS